MKVAGKLSERLYRRDLVAKSEDFAVDTPVAPHRILAVETQDQLAVLPRGRRTPWLAAGGLIAAAIG